jgi:autotransporter strand-loop-strand O-heptosyltransferase
MNHFKFNYKTTLPKEANAPSVTISGDEINNYVIRFSIIKKDGIHKVKELKCNTNQTIYSNINQWYSNWLIEVYKDNQLIITDTFDVTNKVVFIKMDGRALGDNIAWAPYVDEFRKHRNCTVICSTFFNDLFKNIYPEILFVQPNTNIDNVYAQYYIGASKEWSAKYSPVCVDDVSLQYVASMLLNLPTDEVRPELEKQFKKINYTKKYVCISEFASHENKHWKYENGWQTIVDYLNSIGYDVVAISKENTNLKNVIDLTGDKSIMDRGQILTNAEFFIGLSSGLSWLSWAVNTYVFLISDITPINHEFKTNVTRISANPEIDTIRYDTKKITTPDTVIESIKKYLESKNK